MSQKLGKRIKYLRKAKSWTLQDLAGHSGLSVSYLSSMENGRKVPSVSTIKSLAEALSIPQSMLFDSLTSSDMGRPNSMKDISFLPSHLIEFVCGAEGLPYLEAAYQARESGLGPELLEDVIKIIGRIVKERLVEK